MGLLLNAAVFTAFERIPIALALMLFYTYPAGVVVVDAALGRETITPTRLLALLLSTTGVVLVLAGGMDGNGGAPIDPVGVLLALVAAAAQVVFITISRNGYRSVPTETATLVIIGTSMVGGALLAVARRAGGLAGRAAPVPGAVAGRAVRRRRGGGALVAAVPDRDPADRRHPDRDPDAVRARDRA